MNNYLSFGNRDPQGTVDQIHLLAHSISKIAYKQMENLHKRKCADLSKL